MRMNAAGDQHVDRDAAHRDGALRLVPALTAPPGPHGGFMLTKKFLEGLDAYRTRWPGPVSVHLVQQEHRDRHMDAVEVQPGDTSIDVRAFDPRDSSAYEALFDGAAVLLVTLVDRNLELINAALDQGVAVVLVTEQNRRTRREIIRAENSNPVLRWRRQWWSNRIERRYVDAVAAATGVQCNGTPTFDAYHAINANPLLYFDSRLTESLLPAQAAIDARLDQLTSGGPLRLAFTGRLVSIKGVDDLPIVAEQLVRLGVDFTLEIIGGGEPSYERWLAEQIDERGLSERVRMRGVMDFRNELVPHLAREVDLFVCCHRQGDPSCTYLETLSCGVPIIGYDNEAWDGVLRHGGGGWSTPLDDPSTLAARIAELDGDRSAIVEAAAGARVFGLQHTFERTMDRRARHLEQCAKAGAVEVCA